MKKRIMYCKFRLILYASILFIFLLTPCEAVENGPFSVCLIYNFFGIECFTCGVTRGVYNLFHGNFLRAWEFNPLSYPIAILYLLFFFTDAVLLWKRYVNANTSFTSLFEKLWKWIFR